ncbi:mediator of RNA polymerase II transcription subunit 5 [[Candida] jaroonii]|uniref:Mediator of RNA polymerase II transcription subunit 5 n=1 Tax=[Candida] jaroonii TaxID=467808 RepID=A0ACA9Y341_9ASCO|nr:mediator of RNA polymerase II transcription subunit 5 [[Candida] jaroonii]
MNDLHKLIQLCNRRKVGDKQFLNLFSQLNKQIPVSSGEFRSLLEDSSYENYLVLLGVKEYKLFWESMNKLPINQQLRLLKKLQSKISLVKEIELFLKYFVDYSNSVINDSNDNDKVKLEANENDKINLINELIFNCEIILKNFNVKELNSFKTFMDTFMNFLNNNEYVKQLEYCNNKFPLERNGSSHRGTFNTDRLSHKKINLSLNIKSKNYKNYENLKIFFWFNNYFKKFEIPNNETLIKNFNENFNGDCSKFIFSIFNGINYCLLMDLTNYVYHNWTNFLNSRLSKIIQLYKIENIDDVIISVFETFENNDNFFVGKSDLLNTLKQNFIKSLIFNKFLSIKSFNKFFPTNENKVNQQILIHEMSNLNSIENFNNVLNDKLYNLNCEFISIEESNLIEYFNEIPNRIKLSMNKQIELVQNFENFIDLLINESNFEKLNRLILLILQNNKLFNLFLFNLPNKNTIFKLMKLIDNDSFKINDDNESLFQEIYSYFGNLILFMIKISKYIDLEILTKNSFFSQFLNNFNSNFSNLTLYYNNENDENDENKTIIENYSNLINDWIQSLFNESEGGLSDEIIKSIDVKQINQLIPIIYQYSIIALVNNKIDKKIFNNGLDYLSQNFLLSCNLSIVNWLKSKIELKNQSSNKYLDVLVEIINLIDKIHLDSNNELKLASGILLNMIYDSISDFKYLNIDKKFLLDKLETFEKKGSTEFTDDINSSPKIINFSGETLTFESFEENLIKCFNGSVTKNSLLIIENYLRFDKSIINSLLINLNSSFKSNNENLKYLIDFVIFYNLFISISSIEDKKFWIKRFNNKLYEKSFNQDTTFISSMDNHYSSIFNDNNDDNFNEDELFESISFEYSIKESNKYSLSLIEFFRTFSKFLDSNQPFDKPLNMIHEKLLNDLIKFQV